jgi:hypothetical protein
LLLLLLLLLLLPLLPLLLLLLLLMMMSLFMLLMSMLWLTTTTTTPSAQEFDVEALVAQRNDAVRALDATKQHLLSTSRSLDDLRVEYEDLLTRHDSLQRRMDRLVSLTKA